MDGGSVGSNGVRKGGPVAIAAGDSVEKAGIVAEVSSVGDKVLTGLLLLSDPRSVGLGVVDDDGDEEGHWEKFVQYPSASLPRHE